MPVTLRDVASAVGLDVSTVSRALRDDPRVTATTRARIRALAGELGYQPNLAARNLVTGQTHAIWLVLGGITSPIDYEPAQAASRACTARGYDLHIVLHHGDPATLERTAARLRQHVADGALWVSSTLACERRILSELVHAGFPLVFLDRHVPSVAAATFTSDNAHAAARLVERCRDAGCTALWNLFSDANPVERARRHGAAKAARNLGLSTPAADEIGRARSKLAILASGPDAILDVVRRNAERLTERSLVFGCFDLWPGEPHPAERVLVCRQDFATMAARATEFVLDLVRGTAKNRARIAGVPATAIEVVTANPRLKAARV